MKLNEIHSVYFIGIGGIGMSAIARYFLHRNIEVSGYDSTETELTRNLSAEGVKIHFQPNVDDIPKKVDLVVYTPAIPGDHPELKYYRQAEKPVKKRAEVLGMISENRYTIAVAGSHGKTTVSTMIAHILKSSGFDCTAFLGGISINYNSNFIAGENEVVVMEADEFDRSFLHLHPNLAIITSIDSDHLEVYGSQENLEGAFVEFMKNIPNTGSLLLHHSLKHLSSTHPNCQTYSLENRSDFSVEQIEVSENGYSFQVLSSNSNKQKIELQTGGRHNIENALAAIATAQILGTYISAIAASLKTFTGIKRRFEIIFKTERAIYIDDYAHHPSELKTLILSCKELYPKRKLTLIFQPHLFSRTAALANEFARSLDLADEVILMEIYPAREQPIPGVSSKLIKENMQNRTVKIMSPQKVLEDIKTRNRELLVTAGAGDIDQLVKPIKSILQKTNKTM